MKRQKTHGEKVIEFDNSLGTVKEFNEIFEHCQLKNIDKNLEIEIGSLINDGELTKRIIFVDGKPQEHLFCQFPQLWKKYQVGEEFFSSIKEMLRHYRTSEQTLYKAFRSGIFRGMEIKKLY